VTPADSIWPASTLRRDDGGLEVGGCEIAALAAEFGTPLYVVDEVEFRARAAAFRTAFGEAFGRYGAKVDVYYAGKAFLCSKVASWMKKDKLGIDVASAGELELAMRGGMPPERITFHGNNKSDAEIERALEVGVGRIVVDSLEEVGILWEEAESRGVTAPVLVRVATGVHAGGHEHIATAHEDQKFGLSLGSGAAAEALALCHEAPSLRLLGIHTHIGSQILSAEAFQESAERMLGLRAEFARSSGYEMPEVGLGGGYGIAYLPGDEGLPIGKAAKVIAASMARALKANKGSWPRVSIEPGRAIAGPAGITVYTVGVTKTVRLKGKKRRRYIAVDGGMSDNMRPVTYGAEYTAELASRLSDAQPVPSRVVGKHCESGDILVRDIGLPEDIARGDLLAVPETGAYGRVMANNYNALPRPAVVAVKKGKTQLLIRRDTLEDLLAWDVTR
jgi:diaminopimelate decarboxylase